MSKNAVKKPKPTAVETSKYSYDAWEDGRVWPVLLHDPAVDTHKEVKLAVVDFTGQETQDLIALHRFNTLKFHLYRYEPDARHLKPGQEWDASDAVYMVSTKEVLDTLLKVWEPLEKEAPLEIVYFLPKYDTPAVKLMEMPTGLEDASYFENAEWIPEWEFEEHRLPIIGPLNAMRILLVFQPLKDKPADGQKQGVTEETAAQKKHRIGVEYLESKYGEDPDVQAIQATAGAEGTASRNKCPQTIAVLVRWVHIVDKILSKHTHQRVSRHKFRFVQKHFEIFFKRRWEWLQQCRKAEKAIQTQKKKFADVKVTRREFRVFLQMDEQKVGLAKLIQAVRDFENTRGKLSDVLGEGSGEEESDSESSGETPTSDESS